MAKYSESWIESSESPVIRAYTRPVAGCFREKTARFYVSLFWLPTTTLLPVEEAREGKIFPDHVYVIIPNITPTITSQRLHLRSRDLAERPHRPVDTLFLSLAEERGPNVIGVILSGCGSDGAKGIQAIKEAGGITFAEEENSASFFGMPSSAIQTGFVDFILNPRDIAQGLIGISRQYRLQKGQNKLRVSDPGC
jgi:chemotaxis response regulator CheB